MKKLLTLILLLPLFAKSQVIVSQPQNFTKYIIVKDSTIAQNTISNSDSSHLVPTTAWVKRNQNSGNEFYLTPGYGFLGTKYNGSSAQTFSLDSTIAVNKTFFNTVIGTTALSRINARVKYTDTAAMLAPYLHSGAISGTNNFITQYTGTNSQGNSSLNYATSFSGISGQDLFLGTLTPSNNARFALNTNVNFTSTNGYHGFGDYNTITQTGAYGAYASYDIQPNFNSSFDWTHFVGVQARPVISGAGGFTNYIDGLESWFVHNGTGIVNQWNGLRIRTIQGTGPINHTAGIYIESNQDPGTIDSYNIYSEAGLNYFTSGINTGASANNILNGTTSVVNTTSFQGVTITGNGNPAILQYSTSSNSGARDWRSLTNVVHFGDWQLQQSTTKNGSSFANVIYIDSLKNVTLYGGVNAPGTVSGNFINSTTFTNGALTKFNSSGNIIAAISGTDYVIPTVTALPSLTTVSGGTFGTNAFNSTAYLPLTGGTLTGVLNGTTLTLSHQLVFGSPTAFLNGSIYNDPTDGTSIIAKAGTSTDYSLFNPGGSSKIMSVPTGTLNVILGGNLSTVGYTTLGTIPLGHAGTSYFLTLNTDTVSAIPASSVFTPTGLFTPQIVGRTEITNATSAQTLTAYTVGASNSSFDVSANILVTVSTLHNFGATCTYTDESNTSRVLTLNFSQLTGTFITAITNGTGASAYEGVPVHIRAKGGTTITIATTGTFTGVTYTIEGIIEQIY